MPNPPSITLIPGPSNPGPPIVGPQAVSVVVTANGVLPDGSNPGTVDTVTPLTLTPQQGVAIAPSVGVACTIQIDPNNNRRVIMTPTAAPGGGNQPFSFRVSAAGRTQTVLFSGTAQPVADVSGVAWDGVPPTVA